MKKSRKCRAPKPRGLSPADLEKWVRVLDSTVETLVRLTGELSTEVQNLNASLKAVNTGAARMSELLLSQLVGLRDLFISKGLVTAEEAAAFAQIADLEQMLRHPSDTDSNKGESNE